MRLQSRCPDDTERIGVKLGRLLNAGDVVGLYGELGAGKTTLVKGIASAIGVRERDITSASFTIIAEYDTKPPFYHIDLYRLEKVKDLEEIGLRDYIGGDGISVIEWAERAEDELPEKIIRVELKTIDKDTREIIIEGIDEKDWDNL